MGKYTWTKGPELSPHLHRQHPEQHPSRAPQQLQQEKQLQHCQEVKQAMKVDPKSTFSQREKNPREERVASLWREQREKSPLIEVASR